MPLHVADDLPTADFLFIWYTYLVHPRLYFEDNVSARRKTSEFVELCGLMSPSFVF